MGMFEKKMPVLMFSRDGYVADENLSPTVSNVANHKTREAWGRSNIDLVYNKETGKTVQLLSELDFRPIRISGEPDGKDKDAVFADVCKMAEQTTDDAISIEQEDNGITKQMLRLFIIAMVLTAAFVFQIIVRSL